MPHEQSLFTQLLIYNFLPHFNKWNPPRRRELYFVYKCLLYRGLRWQSRRLCTSVKQSGSFDHSDYISSLKTLHGTDESESAGMSANLLSISLHDYCGFFTPTPLENQKCYYNMAWWWNNDVCWALLHSFCCDGVIKRGIHSCVTDRCDKTVRFICIWKRFTDEEDKSM